VRGAVGHFNKPFIADLIINGRDRRRSGFHDEKVNSRSS
jgi:hypothetical protein